MRTIFTVLCFANIALGQRVSTQNVEDPFNAPDIYNDNAPGVTTARVVKDVKPDYTREAMRRKIEGDVEMMAIIERDGSVNLVRIIQSLDPTYGLDAAAVKTLKKWRFSPATRNGVAVRLRIRVVMTFTMFAGDTMTGPVLEWPSAFHARVHRNGPTDDNRRFVSRGFRDSTIQGFRIPR